MRRKSRHAYGFGHSRTVIICVARSNNRRRKGPGSVADAEILRDDDRGWTAIVADAQLEVIGLEPGRAARKTLV